MSGSVDHCHLHPFPTRRSSDLAFASDVLKEPVKISGQPVVNLIASTSGTDSDWVVKIIDVYPDEVADQEEMGGYQLMRSEEHTSELQSLTNLVCRLLLEKKKEK